MNPMDAPAPSSRFLAAARSATRLEVIASCVGLVALSIAQPILDLLGRNPEFFLARSAPVSDVLLVGLVLGVLVPVLAAVVVVAIREASLVVGTAVHVVLLTMSVQFLVVEVVERVTPASSTVAVLLGVGAGISMAYAFYRFAALRSFFKVAGLAPVAIVLSFLVLSPLSRLVFPDRGVVGPAGVMIGNPVPIVMVVFDEFPLVSLIDGDGNLQKHNYPNFARLAQDGYWFRNAVTNETNTERAIPSIVTGSRADPDAIPIFADYTDNMFSLLGGAYEIDAIEDLTDLCPESACERTAELRWQDRWAGTLEDLSIVGQHMLLPEEFTAGLPPIDQTWSGFGALQDTGDSEGAGHGDEPDFDLRQRFHTILDEGRQDSLSDFLKNLGASGERPSFDFIHVLLPHSPWEYLPDGRRHGAPQPPRGSDGPGWGTDRWLVDQIYQRHLLQVQYTDTFIGEMIATLQDLDLYDDALIVVLADHGIAIAPGLDHRRRINADTIGEMVAVPLFIKPPGGSRGEIDDYRAELIDVMPTIADVLDVELPWTTEGVSLFAPDRPVRNETVINPGEFVISADGEEKLESARRKIEIFGPGSPFDLAPPGSRDLLWKSVDELVIAPAASLTGEVANADRYVDFDTSGGEVLVNVQGILEGVEAGTSATVAMSVNGTISAITQTYVRDGTVLVQAIVPLEAFETGDNQLRLILVEGSGPQRELSFILPP
jgi:Sulfatase